MNLAFFGGGGSHGGRVDPSLWTRGEILAVRGALFTARYPLPYGPRPSDASNILNVGSTFLISQAERTKALKAYTDRGYTHAAMGPWIPAYDQNYHGLYPNWTPTFDQYLDAIQELADAGLKAACFIKPDDWTIDDLDRYILPPYRANARAGRLIRLAVPMGWEPGLGTSNAEYCAAFRLLREALPDAQLACHMVADFDAPGNNDDLTPGTSRYLGNAGCWQHLAQAGLDVYFAQVGGYWRDQREVPTPGFLAALATHCQDQHRRFYEGAAGWPTRNDRGQQIRFVLAEYASFPDFNFNWNETYARQLGDLAMAHGADGYMDGGTVDVPVKA